MPEGKKRRPFQRKRGQRRPGGRPPATKRTGNARQGWDPVAAWYDQLVGKHGSDYHQHVVLPAAMKMLGKIKGKRVLDVCCGQGVLVPLLLDAGAAAVVGVDASPRLIEAAKKRFGGNAAVDMVVADACVPGAWTEEEFDLAASLMAVHDVPDLQGMLANVASALMPGGTFVAIFMHPCFRIPRQAHWGWDEGRKLQFRRIDRYGVNLEIPIQTHPGKGGAETTAFYHRPLAEVQNAFGEAGLAITGTEELYSHRRSQAGGSRSRGEHRAAREFPMFLALSAIRLPD